MHIVFYENINHTHTIMGLFVPKTNIIRVTKVSLAITHNKIIIMPEMNSFA